MASEFFKSVERSGRSSETWLLLRLYLKTNPLKMLGQAGLGLKLWLRGRLGFKREKVRGTDQLHRMLKVLEKERMVQSAGDAPAVEEAIS